MGGKGPPTGAAGLSQTVPAGVKGVCMGLDLRVLLKGP